MDMKTYKILINGATVTNDYIRGRISGFITVITGMPEMTYGWSHGECMCDWITKYNATKEQHEAIVECIGRYYPDAVVGVIVVE
jgi:hypothetical protein